MRPPKLNARERSIIDSTDIGRLGTISGNGWPHVVPVGYIHLKGVFYVASDSGAVKMRNLRRSPRATLVIDNEASEHGIMFECQAEILTAREAERWRRHMQEVKGWGNDRSTSIIRLEPITKASWFLKG